MFTISKEFLKLSFGAVYFVFHEKVTFSTKNSKKEWVSTFCGVCRMGLCRVRLSHDVLWGCVPQPEVRVRVRIPYPYFDFENFPYSVTYPYQHFWLFLTRTLYVLKKKNQPVFRLTEFQENPYFFPYPYLWRKSYPYPYPYPYSVFRTRTRNLI